VKPSELFALSALLLLIFALIARFVSPSGLGISIHLGGVAYVLPPSTVCIALATALCFFATTYSIWMVPFNRTATLLHFWLTAFGIAVFWLSFYRAGAAPSNSGAALWSVFLTPPLVLLTQLIFVWNVIQALSKLRQAHG